MPLDRPGFYDPQAEVHRGHGANLPHWSQAGATYFVTFRLADSLPLTLLRRMARDRAELGRDSLLDDRARSRRLQELRAEIERHLDQGLGACPLARPECAEAMARTLRHFDIERYRLWAWCVMPNHVHALVEPLSPHGLAAVLHSWKTHSALALNRLIGRTGTLWQKETFDHLVRSESSFLRFERYILRNPERACLTDWHWRGSAIARPLSR